MGGFPSPPGGGGPATYWQAGGFLPGAGLSCPARAVRAPVLGARRASLGAGARPPADPRPRGPPSGEAAPQAQSWGGGRGCRCAALRRVPRCGPQPGPGSSPAPEMPSPRTAELDQGWQSWTKVCVAGGAPFLPPGERKPAPTPSKGTRTGLEAIRGATCTSECPV